MWNRPERLRYVCPNLRQGPAGLRCAVDTANVGPHWGRAALFFLAATGCTYVLGALLVFGLFRFQGAATLSPLDTLLPSRWSRISAARTDRFLNHAASSLQQGDVRGTRLHLASAATVADPRNYEARLAIARSNSYLSEREPAVAAFNALLADFPAQRDHTSVVYHDVLVALRAFDLLGDLALARLADPAAGEKPVWLRAAFIALRGSRTPAQLFERHRAALGAVPAPWRDALAAEAELRAGNRSAVRRLIGLPLGDAPLLATVGESIAAFSEPTAAVDEIVRLGNHLGTFERHRLLFLLHAHAGAAAPANREFALLLRAANLPGQRERMLATLIAFPSAERVRRLSIPVAEANARFTAAELGALWVAASLAEESSVRELTAARLASAHGIAAPSGLTAAPNANNSLLWLRSFPLGREPAWALALRYQTPAAPAPRF